MHTTYSKVYKDKKTTYDKVYESVEPVNKVILARSKDEAIAKFRKEAKATYQADVTGDVGVREMGYDSSQYKEVMPDDPFIDDISSHDSFNAISESNMTMRSFKVMKYDFIPSDESLLENEGFCVVDQISKIYGPLNNKLTRDNFIKEVKDIERGYENSVIDWDVETNGVRVDTLNKILKKHNISYYCFNVLDKCFDKYKSTNRHYPLMVYYAVDNHMYWVSNQHKARQLAARNKESVTSMRTDMFQSYEDSTNIFVDEDKNNKRIFNNIPIIDLNKPEYKNSVIFYPDVTYLFYILVEIIDIHGYIPKKIKYRGMNITRIVYDKDDSNIILSVDELNCTLKQYNYQDIINICKSHNIEWKNQTIGSLVQEMRDNFFMKGTKRIKFTKAKREELWMKGNKCCKHCEEEVDIKDTRIDHIIPLAAGGSNEDSNLQILCQSCHLTKTQIELLNKEHVMTSSTESSFNSVTRDIITSQLCSVYPFIETFEPTNKNNRKLFSIDINRSRKNAMYYSQHNFSLFTVMDQPRSYIDTMSYTRPGLYFIRSDLYFPIRGHGWYSHVMIKYLMGNQLITAHDIKYVVYSSLVIKSDYFNEFIDHVYDKKDGYEKFIINCMIGMYKPSTRQNYKSIAISSDRNVIFNHYLQNDAEFIETFEANGKTYYHLEGKYDSIIETSEAPIYNQILEMEIINLYELCKEIKKFDGVVLDVNTDCVVCTFPYNKLPFEFDENNMVKGYYFDADKTVPKYRLCEGQRCEIARLPKWKRSDFYTLKEPNWKITKDVENNDMMPLVNTVLDSGKSWNINGRAGTGKSHLIKMIQEEMNKREIKFDSLAPTNKAALIINGKTMHKFKHEFNLKHFRARNIKYIFIDEISMVQELFYKFFIFLKTICPELKFIISGDFDQLPPVKDRIKYCNYKNSIALYELCDGQRLELSKCRRSDDTLFNMTLPRNLGKIMKKEGSDKYCYYGRNIEIIFPNKMTSRHLSFTNEKRKSINNIMMHLFVKEKKAKPLSLEELEYDKNSQRVYLLPGMPIIARINSKGKKGLGFVNNQPFTIKKIDYINKNIIIEDKDIQIPIPIDQFQKMFYVAFCITIHKSQGETYNHAYTIHEFERFNDSLKYVALSRATDLKLINII